ncbi:transposase [cyanobacterium endosymbiont of Rhopalodia gibberula]|uniref:transposase n=1 Tax=cyanobacterium endosymbiont of Rhopalodia gibberula TaxID=1763363 RepID=UPI000E656E5A|nr:transposase [cyanobacterium endosymbiont of Rhopalodia gibberula]
MPRSLCIHGKFTAHKATKVKELIESTEVELIFLSPYSPGFNPIENCWLKIKKYLQTQKSLNSRGLNTSYQ